MNDTNKQTNELQEVVAAEQQGGVRSTNPPTYNNSYSEREYQSNLNHLPKMTDLKQKLLLKAKSIATSLLGKPNESLSNSHTFSQGKKEEISVEQEYQSNLNNSPEMIDLKEKLLFRAESIATSLLGKPNESLSNNDTLRWGKKGEISMMIVGNRAGIWYDLKEGKKGDLFALVQEKKNCNFVEATKYLQGMVDPSKDRAALDELYELDKFDKYTTEQEQKAKNVETTRIKYVQTQYSNSTPVQYLGDHVVGKYLSEHRGIKTATHKLSPDLRGVMMMWDSPSKMYRSALLAFARDCEGTITGVQAIYLDKDNAFLYNRYLGKISGSFVEIQKGMSTDSQDNASATNITIIAGGVENALSLQEADVKGKILCSLGVINIENYQPQVNESILIAADNDGSDALSLRTVTTAKAKLEQQGAIVSIVMPPKEYDFNDVLKTQGKEAIQEILVPEMGKLTTYRYDNIKSMFQQFRNEIKSLEKFATAENIHTALCTYKQKNMEAFINYSNKVCSIGIEEKIKNDLQFMKNKFNPEYDIGDASLCDLVIHDFKGKSYTMPEDYILAIVKDKQVMKYINPDSIIGRNIQHELRCITELQKNQDRRFSPLLVQKFRRLSS
ncbi:MAG: toprim domain-containing protein [Rickettsia endosymbiont of Platyusa sonomae]|nr:toprim domain-containing protein [Rickettsia endosymbiont of Platyusa sonomae]